LVRFVTDVLRSGEHFEPVSPRVRRVEAAGSRERVVPLDAHARGLEPPGQLVELFGRQPERRVRLARGDERILDADVELATAREREPGAAARAQRLGLLELLEAEQSAEEPARLVLAARRGCELDVI
jgi:hypothetical protein